MEAGRSFHNQRFFGDGGGGGGAGGQIKSMGEEIVNFYF